MDLITAADRIVVNFGDVADIGTMGSMLWAFDQERKSLFFYMQLIKEIINEGA